MLMRMEEDWQRLRDTTHKRLDSFDNQWPVFGPTPEDEQQVAQDRENLLYYEAQLYMLRIIHARLVQVWGDDLYGAAIDEAHNKIGTLPYV